MEYVFLKDVCSINMGLSPDSSKYNCDHKGFAAIEGAKATISHLPGAKLKALKVTVPPIDLQTQFVAYPFRNFSFYPASGRTLQISPGKNDNLHLVTATSTAWSPGSIGPSLAAQSRPPLYSLICGFCSSARNFALQRTF